MPPPVITPGAAAMPFLIESGSTGLAATALAVAAKLAAGTTTAIKAAIRPTTNGLMLAYLPKRKSALRLLKPRVARAVKSAPAWISPDLRRERTWLAARQ